METLGRIHLKYLKNLQPILNKVGKKTGIPIPEGEYIISSVFESINKYLNDPRVPTVMIPLFGKFMPKKSRINVTIKALLRTRKKELINREYLKSKITRLWAIKQRLIKEENGIETWRDWHLLKVKKQFEKLEEDELQKKRESKEEIFGGLDYAKKQKKVFGAVSKRLRGKE